MRGGSSPLRRTRARRSKARAQAHCARCGGCKARASHGWGGPGRAARAAAAAARSGEAVRSKGRERRGAECPCAFLTRWQTSGAAHLGLNDGESARVAAAREISDFELGLGLSGAIGAMRARKPGRQRCLFPKRPEVGDDGGAHVSAAAGIGSGGARAGAGHGAAWAKLGRCAAGLRGPLRRAEVG